MKTNSLQSDAPTEARGQGLPTPHGSRSSDVSRMGAVTISRNGYIQELEGDREALIEVIEKAVDDLKANCVGISIIKQLEDVIVRRKIPSRIVADVKKSPVANDRIRSEMRSDVTVAEFGETLELFISSENADAMARRRS